VTPSVAAPGGTMFIQCSFSIIKLQKINFQSGVTPGMVSPGAVRLPSDATRLVV